MSDYLITNNKEHIDLTTAMSLLSITDKKDVLWSWLHRYGENYVPTDTTNAGWNALGLCIIYYKETLINHQPTPFGQLINIPANTGNESMQLFIGQNIGGIWKRGGNSTITINDLEFDTIAFNNRHNIENQFTLAPSQRIAVSALDGEYSGANVSRSYTAPCNGFFAGFIYGDSYELNVYLDGYEIGGMRAHYGNNTANIFFPVRGGQTIKYETNNNSTAHAASYKNYLWRYYHDS